MAGYPKRKKRRKQRPRRSLLRWMVLLLILGAVAYGLYYFSPAREEHDRQLRAWWQDFQTQARDFVDELETPTIALPTAPSSDAPAGDIEVLFAPVDALNPWGIDDRLVALIGEAEQSVLAAFYDLQLESVADALVARHAAGVRVAIVSDSHYEDRGAVQRCIRAGIPVVFDERSAFMHNKFCVVDGARVWTGSTNVTENGMYRNNNNALLFVSHELAANYDAEFTEMFAQQRFGIRSPRATPYPEVVMDGIRIECYFAPEDRVEKEILDELDDADATIDFMAFSFTSDPIGKAMVARMGKGVRVRGIFEGRNTHDRYSEDDRLRDAGASVYLDANPYNLHHKVIIVDGETTITGSYNFSKSAEKSNDENVLIIHDPDIAQRYTEEFERLLP